MLRAVNVGGAGVLPMSELRSILERSGVRRVETVLQSGNVIFDTDPTDPTALERRLTDLVVSTTGVRTQLLLRTGAEWSRIVRDNPFPDEAREDPGHLVVTILKEAPASNAWRRLDGAIRGSERVRPHGREAYLVYPDGIGRSRVTATFIERTLGTVGTSRNWNTVLRIHRVLSRAELSPAPPTGGSRRR